MQCMMRRRILMIVTAMIVTAAMLAGQAAGQAAGPAATGEADATAGANGVNDANGARSGEPTAATSPADMTWPEGLESFKARASYALGMSTALTVEGAPFELSPAAVAAGVRDALEGRGRLSDEQLSLAMMQVQEVTQRAVDERQAVAEFFAAHAQREGVTVTPSGLQYEVLKAGDGPTPTLGDVVRLHYKAMTLDGRVIAASADGEPAVFDVVGTMPAWREALLQMPVGSTWRLLAPAELALGRQGAAGVAPNTPLIFELELAGIEP